MYKDRFKKWDLSKNLRDQDAHTIVAAKRQRDALGKESEFYTGNRKIDVARAHQHLRRKRCRLLKSAVMAAAVATEQRKQALRVRITTPPPQLRGPDDVQVPEEILWIIREYVDESLQRGVWVTDGQSGRLVNSQRSEEPVNIPDFQALYQLGYAQLAANDCSGSRLLNLAFSMIGNLLDHQTPSLIPRLIFTALDRWNLDKPLWQDLRRLLWKYLERLSDAMLGSTHLLSRLWKAMGRALIFAKQLGQSEMVSLFIAEHFERRLGLLHGDVISSFRYLSDIVTVTSVNTAGPMQAERILDRLLEKVESMNGDGRRQMIELDWLQYDRAVLYFEQDRNAEAREILLRLLEDEHSENMLRFQCLCRIGYLEENQGSYKEAEEALMSALQLAESIWGDHDPDTLDCIIDLARVLMKAGDRGGCTQLLEEYRVRVSALEDERNIEWTEELDALGIEV
jgi:tetratricopeptide (TPR) repeat protein